MLSEVTVDHRHNVRDNGVCYWQVKWSVVASRLPGRIGKQCRERWFNHLDPSIKKGEWSPEEDRIVFGAQVRSFCCWMLKFAS